MPSRSQRSGGRAARKAFCAESPFRKAGLIYASAGPSWPSRWPMATRLLASIMVILGSLLAACAPVGLQGSFPTTSPSPDAALTAAFQQALDQATRTASTASPTASPTVTPLPPTPSPSATAVRTPPALPGVFESSTLHKSSLPQTYIQDTCTYLKARWDANNSPPGTVVMVIMYHSITEDYNPLFSDGSQVHNKDVVMMMEHAHELGFQTITTQQLADFLDTNARIPQRSLLIIVDDRKRKEYYETHFVPFLERYGWTVTNAWISAKDTPEYLWKENQEVIEAGWVDPQAHGVVHNTPIGEASDDDYIRGELYGSIEAIEERFGKRPVGFIWPGGGFSKRAVELAREAGYRVGFTTNPRGPILFNWIPQADQVDPAHTFWLPEMGAGDPRMTLPRYWSADAAYRLDDVTAIGEQAAAEAQKNKAVELEYYDIVCKNRTGEILTQAP
jgi:peptidoglycan/xylan/chitin deacetylase (PgdA/CDA1 family)